MLVRATPRSVSARLISRGERLRVPGGRPPRRLRRLALCRDGRRDHASLLHQLPDERGRAMPPRPCFTTPEGPDRSRRPVSLVAEIADEYRRAQDRVRRAGQGPHRRVRHRRADRLLHPGASLSCPAPSRHPAHARLDLRQPRQDHAALHSHSTRTASSIFHPAWWIDEDGQAPWPHADPTKDVKDGKWKPVMHPAECLEYVKLEASSITRSPSGRINTPRRREPRARACAHGSGDVSTPLVRNSQTHFETKGTR